MRWFVEVSRVGENSSDEKYCVEAKQWQAALQEARKLRGDSGPLSKFSIELLDDGYRAVDPKQKLRYVVAKAPQDAQLTSVTPESALRAEPHRNGQPSTSPSAAPPLVAPAPAPSAVPAASSPLAAPVVAPASSPSAAPAASAPSSPIAASPPLAAPVVAAPSPSAAPPAVSAVPSASAAAPPLAIGSGVAPAPRVTTSSVVPLQLPPVAVAPNTAASAEPAPVGAPRAEPHAGVPSSALSPNAPPSAIHVTSASASPAATSATGKAASAFPPRPGSARPPAPKAADAGIGASLDAIPPAPAVPRGLGPALPPQHLTQPSPAIDLPPPSTVLRKRQEEPTAESPITYREIAYLVEPGVSRGSVEALLWASFRDLSRELAAREGQKFVQLAVFDHRFERRPERPPLGTLAWKDWRGNPVLSFPYFDGTAHVRPSGAPPSIVPVAVVQVTAATQAEPSATAPGVSGAPVVIPPAAPGSMPPPPAAVIPPAAPFSSAEPMTAASAVAALTAPAAPPSARPEALAAHPVSSEPSAAAAPPADIAAASPSASAALSAAATSAAEVPNATPAAPAASAAPPVGSEPQAIPLTREKLSSYPPAGRDKLPSHPSTSRSSRPRMAAVRRRAGEDLIGELFETLHDLHFMSGVADGAEFVLATLDSVLPCEGVLIHVFDINSRQFVVVRAKGPGTMQAVLHRTPDSEAFVSAIMRRPGSVAVQDTQTDARVLGPRWEALGVQPRRALCGPVRQGGRYLGLLEVVNPMGDTPFHQSEQNAVDYICEQFAEFLANRPIVLDADVILRR